VLAITNLQNLTLLGVGTTADATNPFSTKLNNILHAAKTVAEGATGNIQVKLSKESAAKTASHLFQTNFSGRAELGLSGDDNFHVKTSADGAAWVEALVFAAATGAATFGAPAITAAAAASGAGLRLPHGVAPTGAGQRRSVVDDGGLVRAHQRRHPAARSPQRRRDLCRGGCRGRPVRRDHGLVLGRGLDGCALGDERHVHLDAQREQRGRAERVGARVDRPSALRE
jgi:hypothetical protein